ncbi:unnamed protein product [Rodentolepis nana]|uniref:GuKc domain-containing protein n=1 Tax=Rodentolepis nana TaxID=102285 RepID=A0A158QGF8_RODNA|nr:unnamed protein product [Rodentolepis nana]
MKFFPDNDLNAPVAFCVRTYVDFDGLLNGIDAPIPTRVISFSAKEFIQVKRRFDQNWWIGRLVREDAPIGFIPSPTKLETLRHSMQTNLSQLLLSEALNVAASTGNTTAGGKSGSISGTAGSATHSSGKGGAWPASLVNESAPSANEKHVFFGNGISKTNEPAIPNLGVTLPDMEPEKTAVQAVPTLASTLPATPKKKPFFRKGYTGPPYELVPNVRPVVVVGPALKGYEVTDMMQKALFDSLKRYFEGRLIVTRAQTDVSGWKRLNVLLNMDKKALTDRTRGRQMITALEVQREVERIFDLATSMQLLVLDNETINHPHQIAKSSLAPIMVYIKISSIRVLQRLIKNRGKSQKKQLNHQVAAAEKLLQCAEESFDVVLEQNNLEGATEALANYLESYLRAIHFSGTGDKQLSPPPSHTAPKINENKALPPMIPGRPGLNIAFAAAGSAGFQLQELTCLAGDRHAIHSSALGEEGEGSGEGGEEGENTKKEGEEGAGDAEDKEKKAEGDATAGETAGESGDAKKKDRTDGEIGEMSSKQKNARSGREGKREGGILKLGAGKKHQKQALAQIIPDRAHAIALAEAVVKNANAAAAAAAANKLEVPGGATVGLHQSHLAAHIYASRSSRQAKQRQEEIENARRQSEEAARAAAEAKALNGAQRQEKRRQRRLQLAQQAAAAAAAHQRNTSPITRSQSGMVKFGGDSERGPMLLGQGFRASLKPPPDDEESQSAPGSNLRRNTSSAATNGAPKFKKPIPLIIHPPET